MNIMTLFQTRFCAFALKSLNISSLGGASKLQLLESFSPHSKKTGFDFLFFVLLLLLPRRPIFSKNERLVSINLQLPPLQTCQVLFK